MSTSKRASDKQAYHHGDLRRALVDAATKIVAKEGVAAVTLREVARLAGVSHNAPYRHFDSLSALLAAVATEAYEAFGRELTEAAKAEPKASERKKAVGRAY